MFGKGLRCGSRETVDLVVGTGDIPGIGCYRRGRNRSWDGVYIEKWMNDPEWLGRVVGGKHSKGMPIRPKLRLIVAKNAITQSELVDSGAERLGGLADSIL